MSSKRKVFPVRITYRRLIGTTRNGDERIVREVRQMSDGAEQVIYEGVTGRHPSEYKYVRYGEQCPPLEKLTRDGRALVSSGLLSLAGGAQ